MEVRLVSADDFPGLLGTSFLEPRPSRVAMALCLQVLLFEFLLWLAVS